MAGQQLAQGDLAQTFHTTGGDEIAILGTAFSNIAHYLQHIAEVASYIATGVLTGEIRVRSEQDVLGNYVGRELTPEEYMERYPNDNAKYVFTVNKDLLLDAGKFMEGNWTRYMNTAGPNQTNNLQA